MSPPDNRQHLLDTDHYMVDCQKCSTNFPGNIFINPVAYHDTCLTPIFIESALNFQWKFFILIIKINKKYKLRNIVAN